MLSSTEMRDQGPSWQQETERAAQSDAVHRRSEAELTWRSLRTRSVRIAEARERWAGRIGTRTCYR